MFQKKKLLVGFLEKDNLKLLVFEIPFGSIGKPARIFAGQITFAPEVLKDGFIADAGKFSSQVKIAFAQKETLRDVFGVVLFVPSDKGFIRTIPRSDSVDSFIKSLPYFKEELLITSEPVGTGKGGKQQMDTTYVAFEKKLVEDFQRPFLELGKKILAVKSLVSLLTLAFPKTGDYFLLIPSEKEVSLVVAKDGSPVDLMVFKNEVFMARVAEYVGSKNLGDRHQAYTVGLLKPEIIQSLKTQQNWQIDNLFATDVYDLALNTHLQGQKKFSFPQLEKLTDGINVPGVSSKTLVLIGAIVVGFVLVVAIVKNLGGAVLPSRGAKPVVVSPAAEVPKVVEPVFKLSDYPVLILNGTLVSGEAGRLEKVLKDLGYEVVGTKNATASGFTATRLRVLDNIPVKFVSDLKTQILATYAEVKVESLASPSATPTSTSAPTAKVEIIIGKKRT